MTAARGHDERLRLAALERYAILDTPPEAVFDQFAAITAQLLNAPISMVGMIDQTRHWFKAAFGTTAHSNSREHSFCTYTVQSDQPFSVGNALKDPRFASNPNVAGGALLRAYAGAPLVTADGLSIGTLCIFDTRPREFTPNDGETLLRLAGLVMRELEERLERIQAERIQAERIQPPNHTTESRDQALDRVANGIGQQLGLRVKTLYGPRQNIELNALRTKDDPLEALFAGMPEPQPETVPKGLKLKVLERVRFAQRHSQQSAPARALLLSDQRVVLAHALEPGLPLTLWAKRSGDPAIAIANFTGLAVTAAVPADSSLIGLSATLQSTSSEPDWLALGMLQEPE